MSIQSETGEIDLKLSEHRAELNEAIISAYPDIDKLKTMIRDHFQENPDVVAEGGTLDVKISTLIEWAISHSKEKELIEAAYQGNVDNKKLKKITQKLLPSLFTEKPLHGDQDISTSSDLHVPSIKKPAWYQRIPLCRLRNTFLTSVGLTTLVVVIRLLGVFQNSELLLFDQMMRLAPPEKPDDRLLLVQITTQDIKNYAHANPNNIPKYGASLPDEVIHQLLSKLLNKKPRVIGIDLYRSEKAEGNLTSLINNEKTNKSLVFICKFPNKLSPDDDANHDPPPDVPKEEVGLSDFLEDDDGVIRRQIIKMGTPNDKDTQDLTKCRNDEELMESFSFKLAQKYLYKTYTNFVKNNDNLISGNTVLQAINQTTQGGYRLKNSNGYQIMLNYRYVDGKTNSDKPSISNIARKYTVKQILDGIDEKFIKDKIVLIGTTAESYDSLSHTPFSKAGPDEAMRGLFIQAQMVSQLVSAVIDKRPLIKVCSLEWEILWILFWSLIGANLPQLCKQTRKLIILVVICIGSMYIICVLLFVSPIKFWISFYPSALVFLSTGIMIGLLEFRDQNQR